MAIRSEQVRAQHIDAALAAATADLNGERFPIRWQGQRRPFAVVRLPLDMVVLNPQSHRVSSQLESESEERRQVVQRDPFGEEAQQIIADILENTERFADVYGEMEDRGQEEPGVVTRAGVLINANTRVVALRKLDPHGHVDAVVLPPNPDPADVAKLEVDLQERPDIKQDYTFTNRLLILNDLQTRFGYSDDDAAALLRIHTDPRRALEEVKKRTRLLALIREIQRRGNGAVKTTYFDDFAVALEELDRAYESRKTSDPEAAEQLKEARILGILAGVKYESLRRFDSAQAVTDYVVPSLTDPEIVSDDAVRGHFVAVLAPSDAAQDDPPGLDGLLDDEELAEASANLGALVDFLAKNHRKEVIQVPSDGGLTELSWDQVASSVVTGLDYAAEDAKNQADAERSLTGPVHLLQEARKKADQALSAYRSVSTQTGFHRDRFDTELDRLSQAVDAIKAEVEPRGHE